MELYFSLVVGMNLKYKVIYADPPWKYDFQESKSRMIENHYNTMELSDILALPICTLTDDNCVLFIWVTSPKLIEGLEVMRAWGFNYRTHAVWDKRLIGTGYWFRGQHELLLLGTKGNPPIPSPKNRVSSVLTKQRTAHSKKPKDYYSIIEKMVEPPRLELFAREKREGWDAWGNQVPNHCQKLLATEDA